jgi:hypothetical protein
MGDARIQFRIRDQNGHDVDMWLDDQFSVMPEITVIVSRFEHLLDRFDIENLDNCDCYIYLEDEAGGTILPEFGIGHHTTVGLTRYGNHGRRAYFRFTNLQTPPVGRYRLRVDVLSVERVGRMWSPHFHIVAPPPPALNGVHAYTNGFNGHDNGGDGQPNEGLRYYDSPESLSSGSDGMGMGTIGYNQANGYNGTNGYYQINGNNQMNGYGNENSYSSGND